MAKRPISPIHVTGVIRMSRPPEWTNEYVGIPFREKGRDRTGIDCWGLARLILRERFRIEAPDLSAEYSGAQAPARLQEIAREEAENWWPIPLGDEQPGDIVMLAIRGFDRHFGIVVAPPWMIHAEKGINSILERYDRPRWQRRLTGFFRHEDLHDDEGRRFAQDMIPPASTKTAL